MFPFGPSMTGARRSAVPLRRVLGRLVLLAAAGPVAAAIWSNLEAREPGGPKPAGETSSAPIRFLVLFDGRVVEGSVEERPGGYLIHQSSGAIVLPFEMIRVAATSLTEAYEKQRDNFAFPTANDHLTLAQWCYSNRLFAQANAELEAVLRLEPQRSEARELLKLVDDATRRQAARHTASRGPESGTGERTSGRIRTETHAAFIGRIQPLLVNKCGNATCHGTASTNGFRLANVRTGLRHQRLQSDHNLAAVLAQISAEHPQQSPLLLKPQDREMPVHRGVFFGATGDNQVQMLRDWISGAAADIVDSGAVSATGDEAAAGAEPAPTGQGPSAPPVGPAIPVVERPETAFSRPKPKVIEVPGPGSPRSSDLLRKVLDEERPDPFDPEVFNRQVHGLPPRGVPATPAGAPPE